MKRTYTDLIVVHCSATRVDAHVDAHVIDAWHKARGFSGIGYHTVIDLLGNVESGRSLQEVGAHAAGFNYRSIGVCLLGGLDSQYMSAFTFTKEQMKTLCTVLKIYKQFWPGAKVLGHRDLSPDLNGDGEISAVEYMKDCPCFDVQTWWKEQGG